MFKTLAILTTLLVTVLATTCSEDRGRDSAGMRNFLCTTSEGFDFEYSFEKDEMLDGTRRQDVLSMVAGMFDEKNANSTSTMEMTVRDLDGTTKWSFAALVQQGTGACKSVGDFAIKWSGTPTAWIGAVSTMMLAVQGNRGKQSPRSKCTSYSNADSNFCVSWAVYRVMDMDRAQVQEVSQECNEHCQAEGKACEVRVVTDDTTQYYCVSAHPDGCHKRTDVMG